MRSLLLLSMVLLACDDSTGSNNVSTVDGYQREAVRALCGYNARCGEISPSQEEACKSAYASLLGMSGPYSVDEAISAGRVSYDGTAAGNCIAILDSSNCDGIALFDALTGPACTKIMRGLVPAGGSCKADNECANGWCDRGGAIYPGCPGTCKAFAATGAACGTGDTRCASPDSCRNMVCVTPKPLNSTCTASGECARGLSCVNGTCQGPADQGADCSNRACATGLYCDRTVMPPLCQPRLAAGSTCRANSDCQPGLKCVLPVGVGSGTCRAFADIGQSCAAAACAEDAVCDMATQTCKLTGQLGDSCNGDCSLNLYCNSANKCAAPIPYGGACDSNLSSTTQCAAGTCSDTTNTCTLICS